MLPRRHRLDSASFERAFNRSRTYRMGALSLRVHWRNDKNVARLAFVVPKKLGKAVWRNRVRRRLRAAMISPALSKYLHELCGADVIIFATPNVETLPLPQLEENLRAMLERVARDRRADRAR